MTIQTEISKKYHELVSVYNSDISHGWELICEILVLLTENYDLNNTRNNENQEEFRNDLKTLFNAMVLMYNFEYPEQSIGDSNVLNEHGEFIEKIKKGIERLDDTDNDINNDYQLADIYTGMILYLNRNSYLLSQIR